MKDRLQELIDHITQEIEVANVRVQSLKAYKAKLLRLQKEEQDEKNKDAEV